MKAAASTILEVENLQKWFPIHRGLLRRVVGEVRAVDDVSFRIDRGETLSLVGESGCGKTTTSRCILRALTPSAGAIRFRTESGKQVDVAALPKPELRPLRRQIREGTAGLSSFGGFQYALLSFGALLVSGGFSDILNPQHH